MGETKKGEQHWGGGWGAGKKQTKGIKFESVQRASKRTAGLGVVETRMGAGKRDRETVHLKRRKCRIQKKDCREKRGIRTGVYPINRGEPSPGSTIHHKKL